MRSLAVKQQQTNRVQGFALGFYLDTCVQVVGCVQLFLYLFSCNYVKGTAPIDSNINYLNKLHI